MFCLLVLTILFILILIVYVENFHLIKLIISVSKMQCEGLRCSFSYQNLPNSKLSTLSTKVGQNTNFFSSQMNPHKDQTIYYINQLPSRSSEHNLTQKIYASNNNYPPLFASNSPSTKLKKGNRQMSKTATKLINRNLVLHTEIDQNNRSRIHQQNFFNPASQIIGNNSHISNIEGNNLKSRQLSDYMQAESREHWTENTNFGRSNSCSKQSVTSTKINFPLQMFSKNRFAKQNEINYCSKESSSNRQNRYLLAQMKIQKQTIQNFQNEIMRLNKEIRMIKNDDQSYKNYFEGLQLEIEQLKASKQNVIDELNKLKQQVAKQYSKQKQTIDVLSNQIRQLQIIIQQSKIKESNYQKSIEQYQDQNSHLNRLIEEQSKKLEDKQISARVDRDEISVLLMKLEAYHYKYQQQNQIITELQKTKIGAIKQRQNHILNWKQQKTKFVQEILQFKQRENNLLLQNKQITHLTEQLKIQVNKLSQYKEIIKLQLQQQKIKKETQYQAIITVLRNNEQLYIKLTDQFQEKRKELQNLRMFIEISKHEKNQISQELFKRQKEIKYKQQQINKILKNISEKDLQLLAIQRQMEKIRVNCDKTEEKYSILLNDYQSACQCNNRNNVLLKQWEVALVKQRQQQFNLLKIIESLKINNTNLQVRQNQFLAQRQRQKCLYFEMENNLKTFSTQYFQIKKRNNELQAMVSICQDNSKQYKLQKQNERQNNQQSLQKIRMLENSYEDYKSKTGQIIYSLNHKIETLKNDLAYLSQFQTQINETQTYENLINQLKQNHEKEIKEIELQFCEKQNESVNNYKEQMHVLLQTIKNNENIYKVQTQMFLTQIQNLQQEKRILNVKITEIQQSKHLELLQKINYLSEGSSSIRLRNNTVPNLREQDSIEQDYVEVDREGLIYMCALLGTQIREGSILNTLISALEKLVQENRKSKTLSSFYLELLELFGIEENTNHHELIMTEICNFRENIQFLIEKLKEEEQKSQRLFHERNTFENQLQINCVNEIKIMRQLQRYNQLIVELNETIIRQNIQISNSRLQIQQVMFLTKQPLERSEQFFTVNSFGNIEEKEKREILQFLLLQQRNDMI